MAVIFLPGQLAQRADFYHQLGRLVASGVSIIQALEIQRRNPPSAAFRGPISQLISRLNQGDSFNASLRSLGRWLPDFDAALLEAGETSGRLPETCRLLGDSYDQRARTARSLIGYMAYPLILLHLAILIFPTSFLTGLILRGEVAAFFVQKAAVLVPLYGLVALALLMGQGGRGETWRSIIEAVLRPVPFLGKARQCLALSRLSVALESLLNAGVPVVRAWQLAGEASGSSALRRAVNGFLPRIETGSTPAEEVNGCRHFPETFASQYQTGEISGQLDDVLRRLHLHYAEEGTRLLRLAVMLAGAPVYGAVVLLIAWQVISFWTGYFGQINEVM
jgi:type II secretory pathway component PulF